MKRVKIQSIELPKNDTAYYRPTATDRLVVLPLPNGKYLAINNLAIVLEAIALGKKTIDIEIAPENRTFAFELRHGPVEPSLWNTSLMTVLDSLQVNPAYMAQVSVNGGKERIFRKLADAVGLPIEHIRKLDWILRDGSSELIGRVTKGMDVDDAIDEVFTVAA